jgi:hypothetical protein
MELVNNKQNKKALYEFAALGWIEETAKPMVDGILQSIISAHDNLEYGSLALSQGELLNTNINRSPQAYMMNPEVERSFYKYDVDKTMTVLSFKNESGDGLGLISWYIFFGYINLCSYIMPMVLLGLQYMEYLSITQTGWSMVTTKGMLPI